MGLLDDEQFSGLNVLGSDGVSSDVTARVFELHGFAARRIERIAVLDPRRWVLLFQPSNPSPEYRYNTLHIHPNYPQQNISPVVLHFDELILTDSLSVVHLLALFHHGEHDPHVGLALLLLLAGHLGVVERLYGVLERLHGLGVALETQETSGPTLRHFVRQVLGIADLQGLVAVAQSQLELVQVVEGSRTICQDDAQVCVRGFDEEFFYYNGKLVMSVWS